MTVRAMPGVQVEESARAGCVVIALRGELDVCTAADGLHPLAALAAAGARIIVDLAELAFMDCYTLGELMAVRAQARLAGGDLVLVGPQPMVLRLLVLCDMVSRRLVFASVDEAVSGAGSAPAASVTPGAAGSAAASPARSGIVSSALSSGGAAMRQARMLTGLITAVSRKRHDGAGTH
jgi:anti-sigma B factor antagonist